MLFYPQKSAYHDSPVHRRDAAGPRRNRPGVSPCSAWRGIHMPAGLSGTQCQRANRRL